MTLEIGNLTVKSSVWRILNWVEDCATWNEQLKSRVTLESLELGTFMPLGRNEHVNLTANKLQQNALNVFYVVWFCILQHGIWHVTVNSVHHFATKT